MAPTILRHGPFRLFFFSREEARMHVHVAHPDGEAKFWLTPALELATHTGLSPRQIDQARQVVATHRKEIEHAWYRHFGARSH
jgi:ribosomal protein L16/L10AE